MKVKVRAALATELAGAVGAAVRDVLVVALVERITAAPTRTPNRLPTPRPGAWRGDEFEERDRWGEPKDPWGDPDEYDNDTRDRARTRHAPESNDMNMNTMPAVPALAAVAVGVNAGRWWFGRHGSVPAAVGFGALATALGLTGGPVARAALAVFAAATDLLSAESALARLDPP